MTVPGDVLLVTAFISYVGCFTKQYRTELMDKMWFPRINKLEVNLLVILTSVQYVWCFFTDSRIIRNI